MNNANALIRYKALDACLRDRTRRYYFKDLLEVVNKVLNDYDGSSIKDRQLYIDLEHMDREALKGRETDAVDIIEKVRDGHKFYYRYADPNYSMFDTYLTQDEAEMLGKTIKLLNQFKGMPHFEWLEETMVRLKQEFGLGGIEAGTVCFSQNPDLVGMKWYERLFDAIVNHEVLELKYHRFGRPVRTRVVHPYQLRQYNNRWYVVGYEERLTPRFPYVVLPIDRILGVEVSKGTKFKEKPVDVDFDKYFSSIVGVSLNPESEPEKVVLKAYYPAVWYMETKKLHASQTLVADGEGYKVFELTVIPNEELVQNLLVYADQVEVMKPVSLREMLVKRAKDILNKNEKGKGNTP